MYHSCIHEFVDTWVDCTSPQLYGCCHKHGSTDISSTHEFHLHIPSDAGPGIELLDRAVILLFPAVTSASIMADVLFPPRSAATPFAPGSPPHSFLFVLLSLFYFSLEMVPGHGFHLPLLDDHWHWAFNNYNQFVCLPSGNISLAPLPIFDQIFFSYCWVIWAPCTFWILTSEYRH